jgi:hypothetical protein
LSSSRYGAYQDHFHGWKPEKGEYLSQVYRDS